MNELALFAGAGGGLLGTQLLGWRCVCAVEKAPYRREVLLRRQRDGVLDLFPIWDDVGTFDGRPWAGLVDVVTGGFPCQPHSVAGKRKGAADERNLWPDTARILGEVRPRYALLENVPGLLANGFLGHVLGDLAALGYDAEWGIVSAADAGAPHLRERIWIVAHADGHGTLRDVRHRDNGQQHAQAQVQERANVVAWIDPTGANGGTLSDPDRGRREQCESEERAVSIAHPIGWWETERGLGRMVDGMANGVDRLSALGDGQVPGVVRLAWRLLHG